MDTIWWNGDIFATFNSLEFYIFAFCVTVAFCLVFYKTSPVEGISAKENVFRKLGLAFLAEALVAFVFSCRLSFHAYTSGLPPPADTNARLLFYGVPLALFSLLWLIPLAFSIALKVMERSERKQRLWSRTSAPGASALSRK